MMRKIAAATLAALFALLLAPVAFGLPPPVAGPEAAWLEQLAVMDEDLNLANQYQTEGERITPRRSSGRVRGVGNRPCAGGLPARLGE